MTIVQVYYIYIHITVFCHFSSYVGSLLCEKDAAFFFFFTYRKVPAKDAMVPCII